MAVMDFPATPTVGQLWPDPPTIGIPQYQWDGSAWLAVAPPEGLVYVKRVGDTMNGPLNVVSPPTLPAHAVSKEYVDGGVAGIPGKVSKSGDTMTGALYLPGGLASTDLAYSGMQINGGMSVSQELGVAARTTDGYVVDGWIVNKSGAMAFATGQDSSDKPPGYTHSIKLSVITASPSLGAGDYLMFSQPLEGFRVARLAFGTASAKPLTLAFWSKTNRTGQFSGVINNSGTGGGFRTYPFTFITVAADVWQYNTITVPGDTTGTWLTANASSMTIYFTLACGTTYAAPPNAWTTQNAIAATGSVNGAAATTDYISLTGVIVLPGIYAPTAAQSPLIMRPYDQELVTCQRYFHRYTGGAIYGWPPQASTWMYNPLYIAPTMRAAPAVTFDNFTGTNITDLAVSSITPETLTVRATNIAVGQSVGNFNVSLNARL